MKQEKNAWIIVLTSQAARRKKEKREEERSCKPILTLCLSLPAHEHWACKSFSCETLGQPPLAPFQKSTACFRKTEGTSLWRESWLCALALSLSPATLSFSLCLPLGDSGQWPLPGLFLSALSVMWLRDSHLTFHVASTLYSSPYVFFFFCKFPATCTLKRIMHSWIERAQG